MTTCKDLALQIGDALKELPRLKRMYILALAMVHAEKEQEEVNKTN